MKTNSLTIAEAIQKVEQGFGSVYTKDDVITLLNALKVEGGSEETSKQVIEELKKLKPKIVEAVMESMESEVIDYESANFYIGHSNMVEIESIDLDDYKVEMIIKEAIDGVIEVLEDELQDDETEEVDTDNK